MDEMLVKTLTAAAGLFFMHGMLAAQTAPAHDNRRLTVSVAASLRNAIEEIERDYRVQRPDVSVTFNFGASGALEQQIEQGAPVDVFLPASPRQMDALQGKGLVLAGTRKDLLVNEVVLIAPPGSQTPRSFEDLAGAEIKLIALGDPVSVPAGEYGRQVLRSLGIWTAVEPKLVLAKDVRQVLTYIESGNADAGIVYASDAKASGKVRLVATAKDGSHEPVVYPVAAMRDARDAALAKDFITFLSSENSHGIFRRYGLLPGAAQLTGSSAITAWDFSPLWISVKTSAAATALTFVLGLLAAWAMSRYQGRGRALIDGVFTLPLVLPPTVIGFFLLVLFGRNGALGQLLLKAGLTIAFSWPATVIAATVVAFPLMYRTTLGALEQVTPSLLDAARTLGASEWRVFRGVAIPLAWPGVLAGTVLAFARALGEFGATLMLAGNIPGRTQTMPVAIFFAAEGGQMNRALAWVILIVAVSLAVIAALNYWSRYRRAPRPSRQQSGPSSEWLTMSAAATRYRVVRQSSGGSQAELLFEARKRANGFTLKTAFHVSRGALGLLGPSGSGKSMTLRCIAGIDTPDSGRIVLNGRVLFDGGAKIDVPPSARRIGVLFQDYALFPHLTVRQNIAFGLAGVAPEERDNRTAEVVNLVRLDGLLDRYPAELSGGQKQRVALARALAIRPDALLLDEPFSALDPHLRRQLEEQLREALTQYQGVVLFVTHDMEEAFRFCQDLLVLDGGEVIASGPKHDLFEQPRTTRAARLTGCKNIAKAERLTETTVRVGEWRCDLVVDGGGTGGLTHIGVRAHHLKFADMEPGVANVFPCWLVEASESPHEITLYLHLQEAPREGDTAHLQMEIAKDAWPGLRERAQPWHVCLAPNRLLLLAD